MVIRIRYYQSSDYKILSSLLKNVYDSNINQETLERVYISDTQSILIAVTEDEVLVGCAFIEELEDYVRPSRTLYVTYVAVDENYRRHGIGGLLFDKVEEECRQRKCTTIELTSADFRTDAHKFYYGLGFAKKKTTMFIKEMK